MLDPFLDALVVCSNMAALTANFMTQVGVASRDDRFKVVFLDAEPVELTINFGEFAVLDDSNNNKMFNYVDV